MAIIHAPIRIVLADDHVMVRQGLKFILEEEGFQVVGEASNGQEIIRLAEKLVPDVAVVDVGMPLLNGIDATKGIVKVSPRTKIILLSMHRENHFVMNALRAGARGYLLKERASEDLVQAVTEVTRGGRYLSPSIARTVIDSLRNLAEQNPDALSVRERQVLQLIAEGKTAESRRKHSSGMPIRIVLADAHVIVRQELTHVLEDEGFQVVGEASNEEDVVLLAERLEPDVAVLDVGILLPNGIDAVKEIIQVSPRTKIILLTTHSENRFLMNALRAGACGYLLKKRAAEELEQAVTEVMRGGTYLSPSISRVLGASKKSWN